MSTAYEELIKYMGPFLCGGVYTAKVYCYISVCSQRSINYFFNYLGMKSSKQISTQHYIGTEPIKLIPKSTLHMTFKSILDYQIWFYDIDSIESITSLKGDVYMAPIYCKINGKNHVMLFIVNKVKQFVYVVDTNCTNNYSSLFEIPVKKVFSRYNNIHRTKYVVKRTLYGRQKLNKSLNPLNMCVQLSLFIAHYIQLTNEEPTIVLKRLNAIDRKQLSLLLKSHSTFYYICTIK